MQCVYKLNFTSSQTQYALVQCFPDLLPEECKSCLTQSMTQFNFSRVGGRVLFPSCNSRYEIYPFYEETFVATLPPSPLITYPPLPLVTAPSLPWLQLLHCRLVKTSLYLFFSFTSSWDVQDLGSHVSCLIYHFGRKRKKLNGDNLSNWCAGCCLCSLSCGCFKLPRNKESEEGWWYYSCIWW